MLHNTLRTLFFSRTSLPHPGGTMGFRQDKTQVLTGDDTHWMVGILDTLARKVGSRAPRSDFGALGGYSEALRIYPSRGTHRGDGPSAGRGDGEGCSGLL